MTGFFDLAQIDAVAWLRAMPRSSVDLVVTDPAYESLEKHRAVGTTTRLKKSKASSNNWFSIFPNARFRELFAEIYRVLKKDTHFYLFCDPETMFVAKPIAEEIGFKFWKPLIWDKRRIGMGYHYRARYECILFFENDSDCMHQCGSERRVQMHLWFIEHTAHPIPTRYWAGTINRVGPAKEFRPNAYYGPNYPRLRQVKGEWDPHDIFHHAQSITSGGRG